MNEENEISIIRLDSVTMPLVRLMNKSNLSWAQLEQIAWSIQECINKYEKLEEEINYIRANSCQHQKPADIKELKK